MTKMVSLAAGVVVERVGDDLMVIVPGHTDVVKLSGASAAVLLDVQAGTPVSSNDTVVEELVDLGIVSAPGLSRRGLIKVGAIGAGAAGIAVLAMPGVAAASSVVTFDGLGFFEQGGAPQEVIDEFGQDKEDDLYIVVFPNYAAAGVDQPTSRLTGTITSNQFSGSREAVFIPDVGGWVARVSGPVGTPPTTGTFVLNYQNFRVTGDITRL
jgi:hypothetical protein